MNPLARRERRQSRAIPDPLTSPAPFTLVWHGEAIRVTRNGDSWTLERTGRPVPGPPVVATERWSETVERIQEWLDTQAE